MSARSALAEALRARGGAFSEVRGLLLPDHFGDVERDYRRASEAAGIFDLAFRSALRFTGDDRQTFLHNLLSNDVASLVPGTGCYATLLTQQSKVVADAYVFCERESIRLEIDRTLQAQARAHLEKFLVADDVEIEDLSDREAAFGIFGPRALDVISAAGAEAPHAELGHVETTIGGAKVWVARLSWTSDSGFEVIVEPSLAVPVLERLIAAGDGFGAGLAGMRALEVLRIEAGIPWPGVDFDERYLVLEAGLERGIHFKKGCYLGQEVVERASARGHVNRRLVGLRLDGAAIPPAGAAISSAGNRCGEVTSSVYSFHERAVVAFGYVRREVAEPGCELQVETAEGATAARVAALPFRPGSGSRKVLIAQAESK
jgi:folate-binding protein YgfZ